ncbi:hypothetical protein ACFLQ5_00355 [Bacteroidota bacterium]
MDKWHQPDKTWGVFGIDTFEKYVDTFVIKGRFHKDVHEDVVNSFQTVEYLMAHAYYHYPMYDVAMNKLLQLFEMAIKIRAKEYNIPEYYSNSKRKVSLNDLINELTKEQALKYLKDGLHQERRLRNIFAHPVRFGFGGGLFKQGIMPSITTLNRLFLDQETAIEAQNIHHQVEKRFDIFQEGLFVLENKLKYLVTGIYFIEAFKYKNDWVYVSVVNPVTENTFDDYSAHKFSSPFILLLKNPQTKNSSFEATNIENNKPITISPTKNPINLSRLEIFINDINRLSKSNLEKYHRNHQYEQAKQVVQFYYEYAWVE